MIVFLLGTPGSGKSEFYRCIVEKLKEGNLFKNFTRIDDFPKLWAIFQEDERTGQWRKCRLTEDSGYKVTDNTVWDDILKEVNRDVLKLMESEISDTILFIEFSRPNYVHSILNNFSKKILRQAIVVYLDVPFDICWKRNVCRHQKAIEAGSDDHLVSRKEMEETYGFDDKDMLKKKLPMLVIFINPDTEEGNDFRKLYEGVEKVVSVIYQSRR